MITKVRYLAAVLIGLATLWPMDAHAHPDTLDAGPDWTGTLEELLALFAPSAAYASEFEGPTKPVGISAKPLGVADLTNELPGLETRNLRARFWTMAPGGIVPVHTHANRPAYVYVLQGQVTEHRSDSDEPDVFNAGDLSVEAGGVVHWWENTGDTEVHLIAIDIFQKQ